MELSFSPDLDARWCYALVFAGGMATAFVQVARRVKKFKGAWSVPRTWLVYLAFLPVPGLLFWLLDRLNVLHDTSVFGAIVVGVAYDRILAGGMSTVRGPQQLSGVWKVLSTWADQIRDVVLQREIVNSTRFNEGVIHGLLESEEKLEKIHSLAMVRAENPADLEARLQATVAETPGMSEEVKRERKARFLFDEVGVLPDFGYLMKSEGLIRPEVHNWYAWDLRSKLVTVPILLLILAVPVYALWKLDAPEHRLSYFAWRIEKVYTTPEDRHRARTHLVSFLESDELAAEARAKLIAALGRPGLPVERVDILLAVVLETRNAGGLDAAGLAVGLVDALRTAPVDSRARIQLTLLFLAEEQATDEHPLPPELEDWVAAENDIATRVEEHVDRWKAFWAGA